MTTTQTTLNLGSLSLFTVGIGDTVECFTAKRVGVVVEMFDARDDGRRVVSVVETATGREMMPFVDECRVIRKFVNYLATGKVTVSDETAERFAAFAGAR